MAKKIITISREFGSGGRSIAKAVAENLGYSYLDKEIIEKVSEKTGFAEAFVEEKGEYAPSKNRFAYAFIGRNPNGMSADDYIWAEQTKIIREAANKGNCVIVGRCSDYVLREYGEALHVFIHADIEKRAQRIVHLYGETDEKPYDRLNEKDRKRKINYNYFTGREWGMARNYHLTLDSGAIGIDKCIEIITALSKI